MQRAPQYVHDESEIPDLNPAELNSFKYEWIEGKAVEIPSVGACYPTSEQKIFAEMLSYDLNETFDHDGSWRIVWRDPVKSKWDPVSRMFRPYLPTVLEVQYLDADGDVKISMDADQKFEVLLRWGFDVIKENLMSAFRHYQERNKALDVDNLPTYSPARGQKPTNALEQFAQD